MSHLALVPSRPWSAILASVASVAVVTVAVPGLLAACGEDEPAPAVVPSPPSGSEPEPLSPPARWEVHEWGLIGDRLGAEGPLMASALPGQFRAVNEVPAEGQGTPPSIGQAPGYHGIGIGPGPGHGGSAHATGKPVLYVHLLDQTRDLTFSAQVRAAGGQILEHWPDAALSDDGVAVRWAEVRAQRGSCEGSAYPDVSSSRCTGVPDHYCEAAELPRYETDDAACLTVGGATFNNLFYRANAGRVPLPLTAQMAAGPEGALTITHLGDHPVGGALMRVVRDAADRAGTRVLVVAPPSPGGSVTMALPSEAGGAPAAAEALRTAMGELGLSPAEVTAFFRAWEADFFGGPISEFRRTLENGEPPAGLRPVADALFYWLPLEVADELLPLEFDPAPTAVKRAILVRIDLTHPAD